MGFFKIIFHKLRRSLIIQDSKKNRNATNKEISQRLSVENKQVFLLVKQYKY